MVEASVVAAVRLRIVVPNPTDCDCFWYGGNIEQWIIERVAHRAKGDYASGVKSLNGIANVLSLSFAQPLHRYHISADGQSVVNGTKGPTLVAPQVELASKRSQRCTGRSASDLAAETWILGSIAIL
jgi:hypothetical protein